jgi:phosphoglycolate phosphatase
MDFRNKELIIFDFDGTLINSIPDLATAVNAMLTQYDLPSIDIDRVASFVGNGAATLVRRALTLAMQDKEPTDELFAEAFAFYLSAYKDVSCQKTFTYPGVMETLKYLDEKGYKMVICSNKPFEYMEPILDFLSIKPYFHCWIGEDSLPEKKPHAAPLLHLVNVMRSTVEKSIVVGDSKNDILAAQNAGMQSIGLTYGYNYEEDIADYGPSIVLNHFSDLQKLF